MKDLGKKLLTICPVCKVIRDGNVAVKKEDNPKLYSELLDKSDGKMLRDYCPNCRWMKEETIYK